MIGIEPDQIRLKVLQIAIENIAPRVLAAITRQVERERIGEVWKPALDQVWDFLNQMPGLRSDGHNVFVYHNLEQSGTLLEADFGVEVTDEFEQSGEVRPLYTPAGQAAVAIHAGPFENIGDTHAVVQTWIRNTEWMFTGTSLEIYGDWEEDTSRLRSKVLYLVKPRGGSGIAT